MKLSVFRNDGISLVSLAFWTLSIAIFCNLNGVLYLLFNTLNKASYLIFTCCAVLLFYVKFGWSEFSSLATFFILTQILVVTIGFYSGVLHYGETNFLFSKLTQVCRDLVTTLLIFSIFYSITIKFLNAK